MKRTKLLPLLALGAASLLFMSCVDVDAKIALSQDGSGEVDLVYRVSRFVMNLGGAEKDRSQLPLPVAEEDFTRTVRAVEGLSLKRYQRIDDEEKATITATLAFADVKALGALLGDDPEAFSLAKEGEKTVFKLLLVPGNPDPLDAKTKEFFQSFFNAYGLNYTLIAPSPVKSTNLKEASVKEKEAKIRIPILTAVETKAPIVWQVEW